MSRLIDAKKLIEHLSKTNGTLEDIANKGCALYEVRRYLDCKTE